MNDKVKKTIWWSLTAAAGLFGIVWTWLGQPAWWPTVTAAVVAVATLILGKPWTWPSE